MHGERSTSIVCIPRFISFSKLHPFIAFSLVMKSNRKGAANSRRDEPKLPAAEARAPQPAPQIVNGVRYPGGEVVDTVDTRGTVNGRQILADAAAYDAILAAMRQPPVAHRRAPAPPRPAPPPARH